MASTISKSEVRNLLKRLLHEVAGIDASVITDGSAIDGDLRMESVAFVEIQVAIEEEYDIQLDPIEVVERNEFASIVDYVHQLTETQAS